MLVEANASKKVLSADLINLSGKLFDLLLYYYRKMSLHKVMAHS